MPRRATLLAISSGLPWPLDSGGHLRTFHLLRALATRFDVRLVTGVRRRDAGYLPNFQEAGITVVPAWMPPRRALPREVVRAVSAAVAREPYVLYRRHDVQAMHRAVANEIATASPDVLYLDHLDSFVFARHNRGSLTVLDLHNVYSRIVDRMASESRQPIRRGYLAHEARLLAGRERAAVTSVDEVFSVSEDERAHFAALRGRTPALVPNGVDSRRYADLPVGRSAAAPEVLFIGTLSWGPNADAARYLVLEMLPALRASTPEARVIVVGRDSGTDIRALASRPGVAVFGSVPDVRPYLRDAAVLAVPLESGGGTRLKILEAFAAGVPVVSSPVGCEGLDATDGVHLRVASREAFPAAVAALLADREQGRALAAQARELVTRQYDWTVVGGEAVRAVELLLDRRLAGLRT